MNRAHASQYLRFTAVLLCLGCRSPSISSSQDRDAGPPAPIRTTRPCIVQKIIDGDTFECRDLGRVRLIGIDSPERDQGPAYGEARDALRRLLPVESTVALERDVNERDRYGRLLAYVWRGGAMVNWWMVQEGWAMAYRYPPDVQWADWFTAAQQQARERHRGLWATEVFACPPSEHRRKRC